MTASEPDRHDVPIVVPAPSTSAETYLHSGHVIHIPDYTVVVPVTDALFETDDGINVRRFLQTAIALAADNDGRVLLLGLAVVDSEAALDTIRAYVHEEGVDESDAVTIVTEQQTRIERLLRVATYLDQKVSVRAVVRPVMNPTQGILHTVDRSDKTAVLFLRGTSLDTGGVFERSTIDAVLADADCDVFVETIGTREGPSGLYVPTVEHTITPLNESAEEPIDSILLPVGAGPHAAIAAEAARAIAQATGAAVTVIHVDSTDTPEKATDNAEDRLRFAEYILGPDVDVEFELISAPDPTDVIVQHAKEHDVTTIGAPETHPGLKRLIFGSVPDALTHRSDVTVLMARDADPTMRSLYYHWKQSLEAGNDPDCE